MKKFIENFRWALNQTESGPAFVAAVSLSMGLFLLAVIFLGVLAKITHPLVSVILVVLALGYVIFSEAEKHKTK